MLRDILPKCLLLAAVSMLAKAYSVDDPYENAAQIGMATRLYAIIAVVIVVFNALMMMKGEMIKFEYWTPERPILELAINNRRLAAAVEQSVKYKEQPTQSSSHSQKKLSNRQRNSAGASSSSAPEDKSRASTNSRPNKPEARVPEAQKFAVASSSTMPNKPTNHSNVLQMGSNVTTLMKKAPLLRKQSQHQTNKVSTLPSAFEQSTGNVSVDEPEETSRAKTLPAPPKNFHEEQLRRQELLISED